MHIPSGLKPHFKAITALGLAAMVVDTLMSAAFGWTIGAVPMIGLAIVSLASGLFLVAAFFFHRIKWHAVGNVAAAVWALAFIFNCWSNMGVATSTRMGEVQQASVQQTTYKERQKASEEAEARLALFGKQLTELTTQNAWTATVSAAGLRQQVADLNKSRESESKLGGCGRKCRSIEDKIADISGKIAVAEQRDDLTKRIEATKAVLAKAREELAGTKAGVSATANQSTLYAKLISFNLASDPEAAMVTVANEGTGIALAIVIALVSAFLTLVGALPHLMEATAEDGVTAPRVTVTEHVASTEAQASYAPNPVNDQIEALRAQIAALVPNGKGLSLNITKNGIRGDVEKLTALRLAGA